jgi:uncharacterized membrane protein
MRDSDRTATLAAGVSALLLAGGLLVGLVVLAQAGGAVLAFLLVSVLPALLGYAGLARTGHLPWDDSDDADEDLLADLKRRYAGGDIDDDELERKVETLLAAEGTDGRRERERDTGRR